MKKYKVEPDASGLLRIIAPVDIPIFGVKAGDVGGLIEKEDNLSHSGNAWVSGNAQVFENARVYGGAKVDGNARVFGDARVFANARVFGNAVVFANAQVYDGAMVYGNAQVSGNAWVSGDAQVFENARVSGNAKAYGHAWVHGDVQVYGNALVRGNARVWGEANVSVCLHIQQFKHSITITDDHIFIGCEGHTWGYWDKHLESIGKKHGYTKGEQARVRALLKILCDQINAEKAKRAA